MGFTKFLNFVLLCALFIATGDGNEVRIGGLFQSRFQEQEKVFTDAIDAVNSEHIIGEYQLKGIQEFVPEMDTFHVGRSVCSVLEQGVAGVFGPQSFFTAPHVQSICDTKEIPHIETRWDASNRRSGSSINLHPHPATLTKAVQAIVEAWGWNAFNILYENELSLAAMGDLLKMVDPSGYSIMVRQLEKDGNYRPVLRDIQKSKCNNVILDCSLDILPEVLIQAQQVGIMIAEYNFIITNLDLYTIDLEFLMYSGTNITGFKIVQPDESTADSSSKEEPLLLGSALMNDAVHLFAHGVAAMGEVNISTVEPLDCTTDESWAHGSTLINYMKMSEIKGKTGLIKFDNQGFRTHFEVTLIELTENGLQAYGTWNSSTGLNITRAPLNPHADNAEESIANKSFIVLIALSPPYNMLKEDSRQLTGNDRYEGFGIELIHELSLMLGFNYTFQVQEDGAYGSLDKKTKQWNGMLRRIMDGQADLAITDLTINYDRESAVDFTMPFMNLGIQILYKKPTKEAPSLFSFLSPFSNEVWMYMLAAYIGVSVLLYVMARISPAEWTNPYPCIEEPEVLENQFSLKNSLWFTIGSLMQQGSEIAPIAVSTRMVAGIWWFFTLIMVSSYTANLAAFLTVEPTKTQFENVRELAYNEKGITYGAKKGGATASFFFDSANPTYKKMGDFMTENPDLLPLSNEEGTKWVMEKNYAFIMESTSIEYTTQRQCSLTSVGGLLDSKGYGIAMKKNSTFRNELSTGVLRLQESGRLSAMKDKWWKEKRGGGACSDDPQSSEASPLSLNNVGGVFVVLVGGVTIACFITIFELIYNLLETSKEDNVSFKRELIEELKFVAKCHGSTKPVRKRQSEDGSEGDADSDKYSPLTRNMPSYGGWKIPEP